MPLIDEQGQFEGMIAVLNDITEQKKYEDRLEHSEQKYRELFQSMKNGVAVYRAVNNGEDFEFVDLNEAGLSMGNKAREEVIGRRVTEVFPGVEKIGLLDVFRNVYRTGQPQSHPLVHYEDENIEEWVENYVYLLPNELIVAVYADTTGQRKAESALENSRASLQTVLDSIPADVYVCDMETYEVLFMNERMKESFGNDYTGEICYKVFRGVDEPCAHCTNHLLLDEQDRPTGVAKWEDYNPVNNTWYMNYDRAIPWINGRYVKLQIAVDVTDKKAHEDELKRTIEKKEFLMRELNHRVKNNLAMISSLIGLKDSTIGDVADLSDIIRQIDAIRIVHEKLYQSNTVTHIDMKDYIEDLLSTIFSSLTAQHVVVEKDIETCSIPVRSAIPVGLITNEIATNAIKHGFTPDEEACFSVALQRTETNDHYIFTLSNSGKPFPDDIDFTNSNTLGLQLVSTLVEQLNGTIALERNPQPVFTITFPVERRES
jgi:two-component sensor histidine kinase